MTKTSTMTHEAISKALCDNAPLSDDQRAALLTLIASDKQEQAERDGLVERLKAELERLRAQVAEWEKLREPDTLHANLMRGLPAQLTAEHLRHLQGDQSLTVGDERGLALWQLIYGAIAHEPLPLKVGQIERAAKRVEDMLKRRAAAQAEPVAVKALGAEIAHEHDEALAELAAKAEAQFQADIRDAARYRVLRDKQYSFGPRITDPANVWLTYTPEGLDQACDEMLTFEAGSNPPAQGKD